MDEAATATTNDSPPTEANNKQQQQQQPQQQQQQQHSAAGAGVGSEEPQQDKQAKAASNNDLFSTEKWGVTPIRQDTPWELPPSPTRTGSFAAVGSGPQHQAPQQQQHQHQQAASQQLQQQPQNNEFARAPGPATGSSLIDNNPLAPKSFAGMTNRSSTWSAFGSPGPNEPEPEWPKSGVASGISGAAGPNSQPSNAFDLMPEFEPGKSWHGSMLMKSLDDESSMNAAGPAAASMLAFAGAYANQSKSPTGSQYEPSGIGTWSPIVKGARPGSKWGGDGPNNGGGDNGRFDDGTAIWGSPVQTKVAGVDWVEKTGDANGNNDKSRSMAGNNQSYRPQQSSSSTSLLMSSNTSPSSSQHNRNQQQQQTLKQQASSISHNFDQVQQQSNALSSQANQPNRGLGMSSSATSSSNVPSTQQLKHMVQQIQLAVQAGHLNPQILNQPLAPVTLQLLYQLLQQIKILHQLQMQASQQRPGNHPAAVNVHITKTKQNILNLQNQIAAQQAVYLKQTQPHNISSRQPTMPGLATGGMGAGIGPALPPGISQSGDSFRTGSQSVNDFHVPGAMVNNFGVDSTGANGLATSLGHMNLGGATGVGLHSSRFDQPWRAPAAAKQHQASSMGSSPFMNHNLMNAAPSMQKSMLNSGGSRAATGGGSAFVAMQQGNEFARAPGPATSIMDNNMTAKPFGITNRSSTWSAFGTPAPDEPEPEWPKSTTSGISVAGNSTQPSNAFDLVPEFEPGKPWRGSMLMKSVEDDPTMTPGSMARSLAPQRKTIWSDEIL